MSPWRISWQTHLSKYQSKGLAWTNCSIIHSCSKRQRRITKTSPTCPTVFRSSLSTTSARRHCITNQRIQIHYRWVVFSMIQHIKRVGHPSKRARCSVTMIQMWTRQRASIKGSIAAQSSQNKSRWPWLSTHLLIKTQRGYPRLLSIKIASTTACRSQSLTRFRIRLRCCLTTSSWSRGQASLWPEHRKWARTSVQAIYRNQLIQTESSLASSKRQRLPVRWASADNRVGSNTQSRWKQGRQLCSKYRVKAPVFSTSYQLSNSKSRRLTGTN